MRLHIAVLAIIGTLVACGNTPSGTPEQVPAAYRVVSHSVGHVAHVGKVECGECHGERGFAPPGAEVCTRCHVTVATPLHPLPTGAPTCLDCHGFGASSPAPVASDPAKTDKVSITPAACMRCHERDQGTRHAVGIHAEQPCVNCHRPHGTPSLQPRACTDCHAEQQTQHAGLRGCVDCHSVHEPARGADRRCLDCHTKQPAPRHITDSALTTGHTACTGCHQPHRFGKAEVAACTTCHKDQPVLAPRKHAACISCHDPHKDAPRACTTCHDKHPGHPSGVLAAASNSASDSASANPTLTPALASTFPATPAFQSAKSPSSFGASSRACLGCHPIHSHSLPATQLAVTCTTCHAEPPHGKAPCLDCHKPHDAAPRPALKPALCAQCHADRVQTTQRTGHADCARCHVNAMHGPPTPRPACETCHRTETSSMLVRHDNCATCHTTHDPARPRACATCHTAPAQSAHGRAVACATCHKPHTPSGTPAPRPACATCHAKPTLAGLHKVDAHTNCATCHAAHPSTPPGARAQCLTCHRDRVDHEPTATRCNGCHPFTTGTAPPVTIPASLRIHDAPH